LCDNNGSNLVTCGNLVFQDPHHLDTVKEFDTKQGDNGQTYSGGFQVNAAKETSFSDNCQFSSITTISRCEDQKFSHLTKDADAAIQRDNGEISDSFDVHVSKEDLLESSIIQKQFTGTQDSTMLKGKNADSNHEHGNYDGMQEALHTTSESHLLEIDSQLQVESSTTQGVKTKQCTVPSGLETVESPSLPATNNQDFSEAPPLEVAKEGGAAPNRSTSIVVSRSVRYKRQLEKAGADCAQTQITDYFEILNKIEAQVERLLLENKKLTSLLQQYANSKEENVTKCFTPILKELVTNAQKNAAKDSTQRRHPTILKQFATALFIYSGPLAYEFMYHNINGALPSLRTVQRAVYSKYQTIDEGSFRFDELLMYLEKHNAPHCISIGEDGTRLISRIDYDGETDRCVGFVLPSNSTTGLPDVNAYKADSFEAIRSMFTTATIAKYAYVYMAQPLCQRTPPFCLACIGTDNKFDGKQVMLRWNYIYTECKKRGIVVLSFGGDGDSRVMRAMKDIAFPNDSTNPFQISPKHVLNAPNIPKTWLEWFKATPSSVSLVQDVVHLAVKLKSRLLKVSVVLPMGPYLATSSHLRMLQLSLGKDVHSLREKDLNHKDKQNFNAVERIVKVAHLLAQFPEALATQHYIKVIECAIDSYLDKSLSPLERIEKAWYALFFVRLWRQWIILSDSHTLRDNFITSNAFMCLEINAHSLLTYIMTTRDHAPGNQDSPMPWMLGSQVCEATFRTIRSMNTTFSTVINFGMLGLLRRLHRLQIQTSLQADTNSVITFPRVEKHQIKEARTSYTKSIHNIKNQDILDAVIRAEVKAKEAVEHLEMAELLKKHKKWESATKISSDDLSKINCDDDCEDDDNECEEKLTEENDRNLIHELYSDNEQQISEDLKTITDNNLAEGTVVEKLNKFRTKFKRIASDTIPMYKELELPPKQQNTTHNQFSPFVEIFLRDQSVFIRKTTVVWLLQESEFVSNDRLFRVRAKQPHSCIRFNPNVTEDNQSHLPTVKNFVQIGDMCAFKSAKFWRIGRILQFARPGSKRKNTKKPKTLSQPVFTQQFNGYMVNVTENVGVLCTWYVQIQTSVKFELSKAHKSEYISLSLYKCTLGIGCFNNVSEACSNKQCLPFKKAPSASLFTKQCLYMTEACLAYLNTTEDLGKVQSVVSGDHATDETSDVEILSDSEEQESYWLKIGRVTLYDCDKTEILSGTWLSGTHMAAVQWLLKLQFPHFGGLKDPVGQLSTKSQLSLPPGSLQILHVHGNHWITVSTCNSGHTDADVVVYDSKYQFLGSATEALLAKLVLTQQDVLNIHIASVNKQSGDSDCGVFSIAYCTALAHEQDPSGIVFNQSVMRQFLVKCLEEKKMVPFPQVRPKRLGKPLKVAVNIYCYCRMPDDGNRMVECSRCRKWYHMNCIGSNASVMKLKWYCRHCEPKKSQ